MSSRTPLILGLVGLAAVTGAIVWLTQVRSTEATTSPAPASGKLEPAPPVVLGQTPELATPEKNQPPAVIPAEQLILKDRAPDTQRKTIDPLPVAVPGAAPTAVEPAVQPPAAPDIDPPKLGSLDPIVGGAAAIKGKYVGSTYEERRTRADLLEFALDANGDASTAKIDRDLYQALKDELIWLRENMGTPPPAPK